MDHRARTRLAAALLILSALYLGIVGPVLLAAEFRAVFLFLAAAYPVSLLLFWGGPLNRKRCADALWCFGLPLLLCTVVALFQFYDQQTFYRGLLESASGAESLQIAYLPGSEPRLLLGTIFAGVTGVLFGGAMLWFRRKDKQAAPQEKPEP